MRTTILVAAVLSAVARADEPAVAQRPEQWVRTPAFEANLIFPLLGLADLKGVFPLLRADQRDWRGELITGLSSDFGWGPITRPTEGYGKVFILSAKLGWRQFLAYGLHVDVTVNLGWRHEEHNIRDGGTLDGFVGRLWAFAGWQWELNPRVYLNLRGGGGLHLFRTDRYGYTEKVFAPAGDLNLGVRF